MTTKIEQIEHDEAIIRIEELDTDSRSVQVDLKDPTAYSERNKCITHYPIDLIKEVLKVKPPAWLCDEIARDEDPEYVEGDLLNSLFTYVDREKFSGTRLLDFGCGSGASTMILARNLPNCQIIGIELEEKYCEIASKRLAQEVLAL